MATLTAEQATEVVDVALREFASLEAGRGIWVKHWEKVAQRVLPYYSTSFYPQQNMVPGVERSQEQYDATAMGALWKFAAAFESMATPASSIWHQLRPVDAILKRDRATMAWFEQVNDLMFHYRYSPHSGFQMNMHDAYASIGAFGTSCLFTDRFSDPTRPGVKGLRYRNVFLGELFFAVNHQGQVDKIYRKFKMTLRQIVQRWGKQKLSDKLASLFDTKPESEVWVIHVVRPNGQYDPGRLDEKGKRFSSHYIIQETRMLLESGGYRCNPYSVARYLTAPGELYGRGPAMNVLPAILTVNEEKKVVLKQGQQTVDPVYLMADDGIVNGFSRMPGAMNPGGVSQEGRPLVHMLQPGNIGIGKELMDDERAAINDAFLVTLFQILVETPRMTATEVVERAREKGALLSPTMGRFQSECLGPMIEREFDLLLDQGLLPPPPQMLIDAGAEYRVEYDAPLNRMMRAEEAAGGMRTFQYAAEIAAQTQDPSVMDIFDVDVMMPEMAVINGTPYRWLRTPDAIAAVRQGRQQKEAVQQITQALPGMAAMAKAAAPQGTSPTPGQPS